MKLESWDRISHNTIIFNEGYTEERYNYWLNYFKNDDKIYKIVRTEDDGTEIILFEKESK